MNFETKHEVHSNVFSTKVYFTEFGTNDGMTAKQEESLFEDFGYPEINLGHLTFEGFFNIDGDKRVVSVEDTDHGDKVSFIMNTSHLTIGPDFVASYTCSAEDVPESQVGTALNTKKLVAEAKCLLFDEVVKKAITEKVKTVKDEKTRFETQEVESLNV